MRSLVQQWRRHQKDLYNLYHPNIIGSVMNDLIGNDLIRNLANDLIRNLANGL
jgi:hypothetical protein